MIFNSFTFLVFFVIVFIIYWAINNKLKWQNILLLISSLIFYGWWDWRFLSLIIFSSVVDYKAGLQIQKNDNERIRKLWLVASLISNLGLLAFFKYFNFFADSLVNAVSIFGWNPGYVTLNIILPVGISFYTFQTLSYTIDIYRRKFQPTKNFLNFLTYIAFFPQLVAGPIERAKELLPQIESKRTFSIDFFKAGMVQIFIGLIRKIVIADNLAKYVDPVFQNPEYHNFTTLVIATVFYAFQIYFDFSGYSDIAIGTAKLLGFKFSKNFDLPYFSKSMTIFWRKWHISLSSWLKDYLYISLGGNKKGIKIQYRNLMITMLLGGLWHGSSWNFVIWGGIHGLILSLEKYIFSKNIIPYGKSKAIQILGGLITFTSVCFAWIFFRATTFHDAMIFIQRIFEFNFQKPFLTDLNIFITILIVLVIGILIDLILYYKRIELEWVGIKFNFISLSLFIGVSIVILCLFYSSSNNFIYFQF